MLLIDYKTEKTITTEYTDLDIGIQIMKEMESLGYSGDLNLEEINRILGLCQCQYLFYKGKPLFRENGRETPSALALGRAYGKYLPWIKQKYIEKYKKIKLEVK